MAVFARGRPWSWWRPCSASQKLLHPTRPQPSSTSPQGRCGRGRHQVVPGQIRYYIFALLFVMFDVEASSSSRGPTPARDLRHLRPRRGARVHRDPGAGPRLRLAKGCSVGLVPVGKLPPHLPAEPRHVPLWVFQWGLACCAIEDGLGLRLAPLRRDAPRHDPPSQPHGTDLVVISRHGHRQDGPPSNGSTSRCPTQVRHLDGLVHSCGGPYWDSYSVTRASTR